MGPILGITSTATAIQRGMERFDKRALQVVADAQAMSDPAPEGDAETIATGDTPSASDLTGSIVGMQADAFANKVLFEVYRKQQEQQSDMVDLLKPT